MKFEEVLPLIRKGKKARLPSYGLEDEYWIACYIGLIGVEQRTLTLTKINQEGHAIRGENEWGIASWAVMADDWEIVE